jgi:hypothetical protein
MVVCSIGMPVGLGTGSGRDISRAEVTEGRPSSGLFRGTAGAMATSAEDLVLLETDTADGPPGGEGTIETSGGDAPEGGAPVSKRESARGRVAGSEA